MKLALQILIGIDLCFYLASFIMYLLGSMSYGIVAGMGILFLSFVVVPYFFVYDYIKARRKAKEESGK